MGMEDVYDGTGLLCETFCVKVHRKVYVVFFVQLILSSLQDIIFPLTLASYIHVWHMH